MKGLRAFLALFWLVLSTAGIGSVAQATTSQQVTPPCHASSPMHEDEKNQPPAMIISIPCCAMPAIIGTTDMDLFRVWAGKVSFADTASARLRPRAVSPDTHPPKP